VEALKSAGGRAHGRQADALDPDQVGGRGGERGRELGRIDILVNAVGGSTIIPRPGAKVDELSFAEWQRLIAFNLEGTFLFCHAVTPVMKRQGSGKIVNISSIAGRGLSESSSSAYAAAKAASSPSPRRSRSSSGPSASTSTPSPPA